MPRLKDFRNTKTISLPNWPDSKVEIYGALTVGQLDEAQEGLDENKEEGITKKIQHTLEKLPLFIKSWNFTEPDANGVDQPLPITKENLGFLMQEDFVYLSTEINKFADELKKKLEDSSKSQPS